MTDFSYFSNVTLRFFFILKNSLFSFSLNEKLFYSHFTHLYFLSFTFSLISCQTLYRLKTRSNDHRSKLDFKFSDMTFKEFSTYFFFFFFGLHFIRSCCKQHKMCKTTKFKCMFCFDVCVPTICILIKYHLPLYPHSKPFLN